MYLGHGTIEVVLNFRHQHGVCIVAKQVEHSTCVMTKRSVNFFLYIICHSTSEIELKMTSTKNKINIEVTFAAKTSCPANPMQVHLVIWFWPMAILHRKIIIDNQIHLNQFKMVGFVMASNDKDESTEKQGYTYLWLVKSPSKKIRWYKNLCKTFLELLDNFVSVFLLQSTLNCCYLIAIINKRFMQHVSAVSGTNEDNCLPHLLPQFKYFVLNHHDLWKFIRALHLILLYRLQWKFFLLYKKLVVILYKEVFNNFRHKTLDSFIEGCRKQEYLVLCDHNIKLSCKPY